MTKCLIAGAGLGGATLAIALARKGHEVAVFEQATTIGDVGAGISLSRSALKVFRSLDLLEQVRAEARDCAALATFHFMTGEALTGSVDQTGDRRIALDDVYGVQLHRADLHKILIEELERVAPGALSLGNRVVAVEQDAYGVDCRFADGTVARGEVLIGADGVRSSVRQLLWGDGDPRYTGRVAYRFLVPTAEISDLMDYGHAAVFQGPGCVFNRYTLRHGTILNGVGVVRSASWVDDGWSHPASREEVRSVFDGWHRAVTGLIDHADNIIKWGVFDRAPLARWRSGRVTLLGDAAHPMVPYLGQGAVTAIEDAVVLARALGLGVPIQEALDRYERARQPYTARVQSLSMRQGEMFEVPSPDRMTLSDAPSQRDETNQYDPLTVAV